MPIKTDSLNRKLYSILNSRGYEPESLDSDVSNAGREVPPEEADVFQFTFKQDNKPIDKVWVTIDKAKNLIVYYDDDIVEKAGTRTSGLNYDDSWYGLINFLKEWAFTKRLVFELQPKQKLDSDMAQRTYMKKKEQIKEGYYPMGKLASYTDNVPNVKIVIQHTRQVQEGEQRYRNVARIFLENSQGERILAPTVKPGIAHIYARHIAEGGVPNDERWNHIKGLCEEYSKMSGFVRAVRGNQFNESAQRLVEAGLNHYQGLRETLSKMRSHKGYNNYFESWTPTLMETENDSNTINELFVQEKLDPRIESVMPILSKLSKNINEITEVKDLEEWADNLIDEGLGTKMLAGAALVAALLGIGQHQAEQVYKNSPQLQTLIQKHKEAKEAGDMTRVKDLERRIRLQKDRLDLGRGEVVGKDGMPIEVKEAPGDETLAHNQSTEKQRLKAFDLAEAETMKKPTKSIYSDQASYPNDKLEKMIIDLEKKLGRLSVVQDNKIKSDIDTLKAELERRKNIKKPVQKKEPKQMNEDITKLTKLAGLLSENTRFRYNPQRDAAQAWDAAERGRDNERSRERNVGVDRRPARKAPIIKDLRFASRLYYNVPSDMEDKARNLNMIQDKEGKWFLPDFLNLSTEEIDDLMNMADTAFGRGQYFPSKVFGEPAWQTEGKEDQQGVQEGSWSGWIGTNTFGPESKAWKESVKGGSGTEQDPFTFTLGTELNTAGILMRNLALIKAGKEPSYENFGPTEIKIYFNHNGKLYMGDGSNKIIKANIDQGVTEADNSALNNNLPSSYQQIQRELQTKLSKMMPWLIFDYKTAIEDIAIHHTNKDYENLLKKILTTFVPDKKITIPVINSINADSDKLEALAKEIVNDIQVPASSTKEQKQKNKLNWFYKYLDVIRNYGTEYGYNVELLKKDSTSRNIENMKEGQEDLIRLKKLLGK